MTCPVCGGVVIARGTESDCEAVYRRRECKECGHVFYTTECETRDSEADYYHAMSERVVAARRKKRENC